MDWTHMDAEQAQAMASMADEREEKGDKEIPVKVAVMIRPLVDKEMDQGCRECLQVVPPGKQVVLGTKHAFTFDCVYGGNGRDQDKLFQECILPLVEGVVQGYNGTVFAYGQTGSGKTYTMGSTFLGDSQDMPRGVIPHTIRVLHELLETKRKNKKVSLKVSFIELHKEAIQDLLTHPDEAQKQCFVREFPGGNVTVSGATEFEVQTPLEMLECLERGTLYRTTASTGMNKRSSRSHAIFTITVAQTPINLPDSIDSQGEDGALIAKLNLVDLAGSERVKKTNAQGLRLEEGIHINKGLLALGNVISALGGENRVGGHVPYRNSKLTRLLQDSLGGNSRTVMVACVSPADINFDETLNTLKYANRARNIKNKPIVNRDGTTAEILSLRREVAELTAELNSAKLSAKGRGQHEMDHALVSELEARCIAAEAESTHLRGELASARAGEELATRRLLQMEKQRDFYRTKIEKVAAEHPNLVPEVTGEELTVLEEHLATIQALEKTVSRYSHLEAAGAAYTFEEGENDTSADCARVLEFGSGECIKDYEAGERMYMQQQQQLDQELRALEASLQSKEEQMRQMSTGGEKLNAITSYYENTLKEIEKERLQLLEERNELLQAVQESKKASAEERMSLKAKHKQMLRDLENKLCSLQEKANGYTKLERLKQKSEQAANRLESQIFQIKQHKVQLMKKIEVANKEFSNWKKAKQKELMQLMKEKRKDKIQLARLELVNKKQEMILKRKTEEAATAKARVQDLLKQRVKGTQDPSQTTTPVEDYSTLVIRPNQAAPQLHNEKQRKSWMMQEISALAKLHDVRLEMEEMIAQRLDTARSIDHLKIALDQEEAMEEKSAIQRKIDHLEEEMSTLSARIQQVQEMLVNSEVHSPSDFSSQEIQRWLGLRSIPEARCMLRTLFRCATASTISAIDLQKHTSMLRQELSSLRRYHADQSKEGTADAVFAGENNASVRDLLANAVSVPDDEEILSVLHEQREECNVFETLYPGVCLEASTNLDKAADSFNQSEDSTTPSTSQESEFTRSVIATQDRSIHTGLTTTGPVLRKCSSDPNYSSRSSAIKTWWNALEEPVLLELVHDYPKAQEVLMQQNLQGVNELKDLLSSFHGAAFWYYRFKRLQMQKVITPEGRRLDGVFNEVISGLSPDEASIHRPSDSVLRTIETSAKLREGAREARERIERYLRQSTVRYNPKQTNEGNIPASPLVETTNTTSQERTMYH